MTDDARVDAPFTIYPVATDGVLHITLRGFWSLDDAKTFGQAFLAVAEALAARPGGYRMIMDNSRFGVQSQEITQMLGGFANNPSIRPQRVAVVTSSTLVRMQATRVDGDNHTVYFSTMQEARDWVTS